MKLQSVKHDWVTKHAHVLTHTHTHTHTIHKLEINDTIASGKFEFCKKIIEQGIGKPQKMYHGPQASNSGPVTPVSSRHEESSPGRVTCTWRYTELGGEGRWWSHSQLTVTRLPSPPTLSSPALFPNGQTPLEAKSKRTCWNSPSA